MIWAEKTYNDIIFNKKQIIIKQGRRVGWREVNNTINYNSKKVKNIYKHNIKQKSQTRLLWKTYETYC